jgi:transcriptional regulator with XRE-family HTH domain
MRNRIRTIREHFGYSRRDMERETGIPAKTWENVENGIQKVNEDHIEAITKRWPQFAYWLVIGKTQPEAGNISPEIKDTTKLDATRQLTHESSRLHTKPILFRWCNRFRWASQRLLLLPYTV